MIPFLINFIFYINFNYDFNNESITFREVKFNNLKSLKMSENQKKDVEMKDDDASKKVEEKKVPEVADPFFGMNY